MLSIFSIRSGLRWVFGGAALSAALVLSACGGSSGEGGETAAKTWRDEVPVIRVGLIGGENETDRLARFDRYSEFMEQRLGVKLKAFPASDYAGVMQALAAGQLEMATLGSSGYAGVYLDTDGAVEPLVTNTEVDGSRGYVSVMYVRADSPYKTLEDLRGASLAFADPNSTSGYLVPRAELRAQGKEPSEFFGRTGFAGGHEQAVIAVLNGQYDAGVTWASGIGDKAEGFTRGNLRSMVDKGMLDMSNLRIIWQSRLIPNGPTVVRTDLPQELKDLLRGVLVAMHFEVPEIYKDISRGEGQGFVAVDHGFYAPIIEMRQEELEGRRNR